jgi:hypothetical protein
LFLFLRIPARSAVNVHKVCIDEVLSFISERSGEIPLFSYQPKCKVSSEPCKVCRLGEVLDFTNPRGRLKDCCCKECTESKIQITRGYLKLPQGVHAWTLLEALSLQEKLRRDRTFEVFKGRWRLKSSQEVKFRREDAKSFGQKSLRS